MFSGSDAVPVSTVQRSITDRSKRAWHLPPVVGRTDGGECLPRGACARTSLRTILRSYLDNIGVACVARTRTEDTHLRKKGPKILVFPATGCTRPGCPPDVHQRSMEEGTEVRGRDHPPTLACTPATRLPTPSLTEFTPHLLTFSPALFALHAQLITHALSTLRHGHE